MALEIFLYHIKTCCGYSACSLGSKEHIQNNFDCILPTEFDVENKTVVIEENGHKESISLKSPSGNPVPIAHLKAAPKPTPKPTQKKPAQTASAKKPTPGAPIPRRRIVTPRN